MHVSMPTIYINTNAFTSQDQESKQQFHKHITDSFGVFKMNMSIHVAPLCGTILVKTSVDDRKEHS